MENLTLMAAVALLAITFCVLVSCCCVRSHFSGHTRPNTPLGLRSLPSTRAPSARERNPRPRGPAVSRARRSRLPEHDGGYRLEVAFKDAADGYNACCVCGFENFKRDAFCSLCGALVTRDAAPVQAEDTVECSTPTSAFVALQDASEEPMLPQCTEQQALSKRQERVRARREWLRRLDVHGTLFWFRDHVVTGGAVAAMKLPGYVLQFKRTAAESTAALATATRADAPTTGARADSRRATARTQHPELAPPTRPNGPRKPATLTPEVVKATLEREVAAHTMQVVEAAYATPGDLAVPCQDDSAANASLNWRDVLELAAQDFPTKYAHFVSTTAALIAPRSDEFVTLSVSRASVLVDSLEYLSMIPRQYVRSAMRIRFLDECGIDAGGLQREWFSLLGEQLAGGSGSDSDGSAVDRAEDARAGPESPRLRGGASASVLQCVDTAEQTFYLNPHSQDDIGASHLVHCYGTGRFIGRALLEEQVVGFHLALPLLKIILGVPVSFSDLAYVDPDAYTSLVWIRDNTGVDALGLTFSLTERQSSGDRTDAANGTGAVAVIDLVENGRNIDVTDENKSVYLDLRFRYTLFESVSSQLYVFLKGVYEVIPQELLMLFDPEEFDYLLCGSDEIDVDDWEKHTTFTENLQSHPARQWFWEIVREMPNEYRRRLLHFATGSSRVPIAGFSALTSFDGQLSPFTLHGVNVDESEYVWSHACFNRLGLPLHGSRALVKEALFAVLDLDVYGFSTE